MVRVKGGLTNHRTHKKTLKLAKGYWMSRHKQIKKASEAVLHAGNYAFAGRKNKRRDLRTLWIIRMNAALKENGFRYSEFIHSLKTKNITIDRKILSTLAVDYPKVFEAFIQKIQA